ncbi:SlyX family protein [Pusillimonas sp. CC-YST705]|uniref:SlyX family protein n=1 Tax=Mesopusillimonas faecipullorum TaxID=2755040 RepID=A0ABS8CBF0_9BURK|nr:SlyX family protein [Mesopusillimonas faecipullorum]MCB5363182.1 SlyX family protein [Mesopusillimonas faecipullorum]
MTPLPPEIENRLIDLEIKVGLADDMLEQLNHTIFKQQQQIELLMRELLELQRQSQENRPSTGSSIKDEIPPHY